jgi:chromosome segregation ATPase
MKKRMIAGNLYLFVSFRNHQLPKSILLAGLLLVFMPCLLFSQNLDDFRTAAAADGVNLIPFPDLRKDATSIADEVQRRKDEAKNYDYDLFLSQKTNALKEIKKRNDEISSISKEIDDFKSKHPDGNTSSFQDEIDKRKKEISDFNDKIKDMNNNMAKASDTYDRLSNARAGLREYFQKALDQLPDVTSNPTKYLGSSPSNEDLEKLKQYVRVIDDQIESGIKAHKEQEDGAKKRKVDFDNLIAMTEYK